MNRTRLFPFHRPPFWLLAAALSLAASVRAEQNAMPGITALYSNTFFRVSPAMTPKYAGAQACTKCHASIHKTEMDTKHAQAFDTLKQIGQGSNPSCLPCHTVGYGLPSGFVDESTTPLLKGVQCESCHGPAARHMASEFNPRTRPLTEAAGTICGGCHTGAHQPTYEEWSSSEHNGVVEDMNPASRISACGRCHSGSVRVNLLRNRALPARKANVALGCPTCHDPHANHAWTNAVTGLQYTNQLRNPVFSTNNFSLSTTDNFKKKYNPNVNVCAQCHNQRGASWKSTDRPPHHSPQYNVLLGNVDDLDSGQAHYQPATHGLAINNQCAGCHMQTSPSSEGQPAVTGHSFAFNSYAVCQDCHSQSQVLKQVVQVAVTNQLADLKAGLDYWAITKAPTALRTKYGTLAWEYTNPGELSPSGSTGPTKTEQGQIRDNIKKARFLIYLVLHDGSLGIHNPYYVASLLDAAQDYIEQELKP